MSSERRPGPHDHPGLRRPTVGDARQVPRVDQPGPWHRCTDHGHPQPWWFATRTANPAPGRFDLVEPDGTCHLAASASCAIIERVAEPEADDPPPPTIGELAELRVWSGPLDDGRELADTTVASARRLTAELATIVPFDALTWPWADTFHETGARGLVYTARFGRDDALALFGPAGAPDPDDPDDPRRAGDLVPSPALEHTADLPAGWQPVAVGNADEFDRAPPPEQR
ncbi:hypothetical protein BH23ACT8_BH23ACT8_24590 [soil metagenome]